MFQSKWLVIFFVEEMQTSTIQIPQFHHKFLRMHWSLVGQDHNLDIPSQMNTMHKILLRIARQNHVLAVGIF